MNTSPRERIYWIDALKSIVVVGIALFHTALVFSPGTWLVNNAQRSLILSGFAGFTFQWGIALLFLLAGAATWFGLRSKRPASFAGSRTVRLGIPLVIGVAALSPLQSYFQHTLHPELSGLLRAYLTFWTQPPPTLRPSSAYDYIYHLWFLSHLLAISLVTLPLCAWLRSTSGRTATDALARLVSRPGGFLLIGVVPLAGVQMALRPEFPLYQDWSDLAAWAVLYVEGFVIMSNPAFEKSARQSLGPALTIGLAALAVAGLLNLSGEAAAWDAHPEYGAGYLADTALRSVSSWTWVVVVLSAGIRWLDRRHPLAAWGTDRPLPFYVLSHPIIVVVARYVVAWDLGVWAKFTVIATISIGISLALCELIARHRVLRLLFGLSATPSPRKRMRPGAPDQPATSTTSRSGDESTKTRRYAAP